MGYGCAQMEVWVSGLNHSSAKGTDENRPEGSNPSASATNDVNRGFKVIDYLCKITGASRVIL